MRPLQESLRAQQAVRACTPVPREQPLPTRRTKFSTWTLAQPLPSRSRLTLPVPNLQPLVSKSLQLGKPRRGSSTSRGQTSRILAPQIEVWSPVAAPRLTAAVEQANRRHIPRPHVASNRARSARSRASRIVRWSRSRRRRRHSPTSSRSTRSREES